MEEKMKKIRVLFLLVNLFFFIGFNIELSSNDEGRQYFDCTENNCGKVEGYIVDPETNQKVNIQYAIWIGECGVDSGIHFGKRKEGHVTRPDGSFSFFVQPGIHCIQFAPYKTKPDPSNPNLTVFLETKYAFDPDPAIAPEQIQKITVKAGQIVKIVKKAKIAGRIKITLVDKAGNKVIPDGNVGADIKFSDIIYKNGGYLYISKTETGDLEKNGEVIFGQLLPWKYDVSIDFGSMGYGSNWFFDLNVEAGKTIELKVLLDMNDSTGIQGRVLDENGNPIVDAGVDISEDTSEFYCSSASIWTDADGQYKIIGLKEKTYRMRISKYLGDLQKELSKPELDHCSPDMLVNIKKNQIIKKDVVLNLASSNVKTSFEKK